MYVFILSEVLIEDLPLVLQAIEGLVEQRQRDGEVQDRLRHAEAQADVLRTHMVDCKCSQQ
jgi:hypothetical protein